MGVGRDMLNAVTVAMAAGLVGGAVIGSVVPASASSSPEVAAATAPAPARVTSLDLLGTDRLEVTLRLSNPGATTTHFDATSFHLHAGGTLLATRAGQTVDLHPGGVAEETLTFDAPAAGSELTLDLPDGESLALTA